jgi:hypothetical protein
MKREFYIKKTEVMGMSRDGKGKVKNFVGGQQLEQVNQFK